MNEAVLSLSAQQGWLQEKRTHISFIQRFQQKCVIQGKKKVLNSQTASAQTLSRTYLMATIKHTNEKADLSFLHRAVLGSGRLGLQSVVAGDTQTLTYISLLVWVIKITNEITVN